MGGINSVAIRSTPHDDDGKLDLENNYNNNNSNFHSRALEGEEAERALQRALFIGTTNTSTNSTTTTDSSPAPPHHHTHRSGSVASEGSPKSIPIWLDNTTTCYFPNRNNKRSSFLPQQRSFCTTKSTQKPALLCKRESESTLKSSVESTFNTDSISLNGSKRSHSAIGLSLYEKSLLTRELKASMNDHFQPQKQQMVESASMLHSSVSTSSFLSSSDHNRNSPKKAAVSGGVTDPVNNSTQSSSGVDIPQRRRKKNGPQNSSSQDYDSDTSTSSSSCTNSPPQPLFLKYYVKKNNGVVSTQQGDSCADDLYDYGKSEKNQRNFRSQSLPNTNTEPGSPIRPMKKVNSDNFGCDFLPIIVTPPPSSPELTSSTPPFRSVSQELQQAKREKRARRKKKLLEQQLIHEQQQQLLERSMNMKSTIRSSSEIKLKDSPNSKKNNHADPAHQTHCTLPSIFEKVLSQTRN
ncbi:hypothetical protein FDP41_009567 [Naegleria fowleri]|uniref:Uncharacterized protein n=1 Tax=Naegleria fowleri TaxID=5763 RepID=A0A6A5BGJ2_NAEFO|nr:uncharacterized protein FDP41_009567 [Naegleria fowleri]KAF0972159.1 hypothetical protein FDP41_009567 [Naegleria fowleri]